MCIIDDVLGTLGGITHLGQFLDDPNKESNDAMEVAEPDEPLQPGKDNFCKDQVQVDKQVVIEKVETEEKSERSKGLTLSQITQNLWLQKRKGFRSDLSSSYKGSKKSRKTPGVYSISVNAAKNLQHKLDTPTSTCYNDQIDGIILIYSFAKFRR